MSDTGPTPPGGDPPSTPPPGTPPPSTPPPAAPPPTPGAPPPAAPPPQTAGGTRAADLGVRIGARLIDHILLVIVSAVILVPIFIGAMFADAEAGMGFTFGFSAAGFVAGLIQTALVLGYFIVMDTTQGRTLGKMLLNMHVHGAGPKPTAEESFKRNAWLLLGIIPVIGGLLQLAAVIYIMVTINSDAQNRGWHDQFAGTSVTRDA